MSLTRFDRLPNVGIEVIDPNASHEVLEDRARRLSAFMGNVVQRGFYVEELGLTWIDEDPISSPENRDEIEWRIGRFRDSGQNVEESGLQFILAHHLNRSGDLSADVNSLAGIAVFKKPEGLCDDERHTSTELLELSVAKQYRGQGIGLGRFLLQQGMELVHPEDRVALFVAEQNAEARRVYEHYTFTYNGLREAQGTFAVAGQDGGLTPIDHFGMEVPASRLRQQLGIANVPPKAS